MEYFLLFTLHWNIWGKFGAVRVVDTVVSDSVRRLFNATKKGWVKPILVTSMAISNSDFLIDYAAFRSPQADPSRGCFHLAALLLKWTNR